MLVKNPSKDLPFSIIGGTLVVTACYFGTNIAYYAVLSKEVIISTTSIGMDFGKVEIGSLGAVLLPLIVIVSTAGAANATIFTGSRISFISAQKGHAPTILAEIHQTTRTPAKALISQAVLAVIFILVCCDFDLETDGGFQCFGQYL